MFHNLNRSSLLLFGGLLRTQHVVPNCKLCTCNLTGSRPDQHVHIQCACDAHMVLYLLHSCLPLIRWIVGGKSLNLCIVMMHRIFDKYGPRIMTCEIYGFYMHLSVNNAFLVHIRLKVLWRGTSFSFSASLLYFLP